eukprot:Awhi_evm1s2838
MASVKKSHSLSTFGGAPLSTGRSKLNLNITKNLKHDSIDRNDNKKAISFTSAVPGVDMTLLKKSWDTVFLPKETGEFAGTACQAIFYDTFFKLCPEATVVLESFQEQAEFFAGMIASVLKLDDLYSKDLTYVTKTFLVSEYKNPLQSRNSLMEPLKKLKKNNNSNKRNRHSFHESFSSPLPSSDVYSTSTPTIKVQTSRSPSLPGLQEMATEACNESCTTIPKFPNTINYIALTSRGGKFVESDFKVEPLDVMTSAGFLALRKLGKKHAQIGITTKMYLACGHAILSVLEERVPPEEYTVQVKNAWLQAVKLVTSVKQESIKRRVSARISIRKRKNTLTKRISAEDLHSDFLSSLNDLTTESTANISKHSHFLSKLDDLESDLTNSSATTSAETSKTSLTIPDVNSPSLCFQSRRRSASVSNALYNSRTMVKPQRRRIPVPQEHNSFPLEVTQSENDLLPKQKNINGSLLDSSSDLDMVIPGLRKFECMLDKIISEALPKPKTGSLLDSTSNLDIVIPGPREFECMIEEIISEAKPIAKRKLSAPPNFHTEVHINQHSISAQ